MLFTETILEEGVLKMLIMSDKVINSFSHLVKTAVPSFSVQQALPREHRIFVCFQATGQCIQIMYLEEKRQLFE